MKVITFNPSFILFVRVLITINVNGFIHDTTTFRSISKSKWISPKKISNKLSTTQFSSLQASVTSATSGISNADLQSLSKEGYVIIPNFIPPDLVESLRDDVNKLRSNNRFKIARIGDGSTNALNTDIRIAETCFLGANKIELSSIPSEGRNRLYSILENLRDDLSGNTIFDTYSSGSSTEEKDLIQCAPALDSKLTELLYAYYPEGGFYRRHRDAVAGSSSVLRCYSLLLYINNMEWDEKDGGELRIHLDGGLDSLPPGESPNYIDVVPNGGTLVLFKSDKIPHEVLDTKATRAAVVGWYNRAVTVGDIQNLSSGDGDNVKSLMLLASAALVCVGLGMIVLG